METHSTDRRLTVLTLSISLVSNASKSSGVVHAGSTVVTGLVSHPNTLETVDIRHRVELADQVIILILCTQTEICLNVTVSSDSQ